MPYEDCEKPPNVDWLIDVLKQTENSTLALTRLVQEANAFLRLMQTLIWQLIVLCVLVSLGIGAIYLFAA